jgi:saccharopine dehydrogenase-like NADP-dependent oxidoreductase
LGGYGFFGRRIAAALSRQPRARVLIGGRDRALAQQTAAQLGLPAAHAVAIDANGAQLDQELRALGVDLLVHTAGPFQGQDYQVARAAVMAGSHYVDLADGRQFVAGIGVLDALARDQGRSVVSGASSVPALSSAVVDRYAGRFTRLDSIEIGISSGARAPGLAAVKGIFGYAGKAFPFWRDGRWETAHGWLGLGRHRFPAPLGPRWLGACDVPDLELLPKRHPTVRTVNFQAGFASAPGHLVVWALACAVRTGLLPSVAPFATPLHHMSRWMEPLVSDQGGMFVTLQGLGTDSQALEITWHLLARHNHGPHIPCGAAIALANRFVRGVDPTPGATPCVGLLSVEEILEPLDGLDIRECVECP